MLFIHFFFSSIRLKSWDKKGGITPYPTTNPGMHGFDPRSLLQFQDTLPTRLSNNFQPLLLREREREREREPNVAEQWLVVTRIFSEDRVHFTL